MPSLQFPSPRAEKANILARFFLRLHQFRENFARVPHVLHHATARTCRRTHSTPAGKRGNTPRRRVRGPLATHARRVPPHLPREPPARTAAHTQQALSRAGRGVHPLCATSSDHSLRASYLVHYAGQRPLYAGEGKLHPTYLRRRLRGHREQGGGGGGERKETTVSVSTPPHTFHASSTSGTEVLSLQAGRPAVSPPTNTGAFNRPLATTHTPGNKQTDSFSSN